MARVVVVGASGHAKVVVEALLAGSEHEVVGLVAADRAPGSTWAGLPILGLDTDLAIVCAEHEVVGGVVAVGDNAVRARVVARIAATVPGFAFVAAVHPSAVVGRGATIGAGAVVVAGAVVGPDAVVGDHAIVNTGASLDHDAVLGAFASLAPGAVTGGDARIGASAAVSIGATVLHGRTVGAHTVVGAGSVVVDDLPDHVVAWGVPARVIRTRAEGEPYL